MSANKDELEATTAHVNNLLLAQSIAAYGEMREAVKELKAFLAVLDAKDSLKLMDAKELAELFGVADQRIYLLVRTAGLPVVCLGQKQYRFDPVAIRRWLDANQQAGQELDAEGDPSSGLKLVSK